MTINPFAPLPSNPLQVDWTAKDHQGAANFYYYEFLRALDPDYRRANPNYRPYQSGMESAYKLHTRRAKQLRATA